MKKLILVLILSLLPSLALAQTTRNPCYTSQSATAEGITNCIGVGTNNPLPVATVGYPAGSEALTGNATGTTGAVVGTLAAAAGKTTYVCGIHVDAIGGTATIGPVTLAGIVGSSMVFYGASSATGNQGIPFSTFMPCIPASATNTAITLTTTANGTATGVSVNMWGYRQ